MKTQEDLYLEYAKVIQMTRGYNEKHGTDVKPWECVRLGNVFSRKHGHPGFSANADDYTFAIAILEGKGVFEDSMLYNKNTGQLMSFSDHCIVRNIPISERIKCLTFTPPQKKRTFMLNGVELPCPVKDSPYDFYVFNRKFCFESDMNKKVVGSAILVLLEQARDKE